MDLQKDVVNHSQHYKRVKFWLFILILIVFAGYLKFYGFSIVTVTIAAATIILYPLWYPYFTLLSIKRIIKKQNMLIILGSQKMTIGDEGIIRVTDNSTNNFKWNQFVKVSENDKNYFLYISDLQAVIISKQGLKDNESEQKLKEYFKKYIDSNN